MKHSSLTRRLIGGAVGLMVGAVGAIALAAPAQATYDPVKLTGGYECVDGQWVVTWTVENKFKKTDIKVKELSSELDGDLQEGAEIEDGDSLSGTQTLPGDATDASLEVKYKYYWFGKKKYDTVEDSMPLKGECVPPVSGTATVEYDCETLSVAITNDSETDGTFTVAANGDSQDVAVPAGETSEPVEFEVEEGLEVDVLLDGVSVLDGGPVTITADDLADCEDDGGGGELPETGASTLVIAGGALALLALGGGMFLIARRRRVTFTA